MKLILPGKFIALFTAVMVLFVLFSCRTVKEITEVDLKPVNTAKLLKKAGQNSFDYSSFSIKRINCQFSGNNTKTSFRINLKAQKDSSINIFITKLNIPVGRILLTPDSVKYVNYIDRNYFVDDYSYISDFLNIDLNFFMIQSIISNNVFLYQNDPKNKNLRSFVSFSESGMYVLQSEKDRKINKIELGEKTEKLERKLKRWDEDAYILQKMYFDPLNFNLKKLLISDLTNHREMELVFDEFVTVENYPYPSAIDMRFDSAGDEVSLKIRMNGFSVEDISGSDFTIPEKYARINVQ